MDTLKDKWFKTDAAIQLEVIIVVLIFGIIIDWILC